MGDREINEGEFQEIVDRLKKKYSVREHALRSGGPDGGDVGRRVIVSGKQLIMRPIYQLTLKKGAKGSTLKVTNVKGAYYFVLLALMVLFLSAPVIVIGVAAIIYQFLNDWGLRDELKNEIEQVLGPE